jgi:predicted flap endonuclease-1-like 5' DNA nuclease
MMALVAGNDLVLGLVLLAALGLVWWLLRRVLGRGGARVRHYAPDALDKGAVPAARNQALIDAVSGVDIAPVAPVAQIAGADDLTRIKGVGPKLAGLLAGLGVHHFAQIAAWGPDDVARIDAQLGTFAGRIVRDSWVEQCGFLAQGDVAGFEARFGKV